MLHSRRNKFISLTLMVIFATEIIYPNRVYAVTAGPSSPEFSSFEPVATTNMVNEFSGQFIYNLPVLEIPGASGGGYALSLAYHSGDGPESEASWVGSGWTLNPGSIIRNKRGVPDDNNGQRVKYYNSAPDNWTVAASGNVGVEAFSFIGSMSATVRYNYYKGFGISAGIGLSGLRGLLSLNYTNNDGTGSFSPSVNPAALLSYVNNAAKSDNENANGQATNEFPKKKLLGYGQASLGMVGQNSGFMAAGISSYINYMLTSTTSPYNLTPFDGESYLGYVAVTGDPLPVPIGGNVGVNISYVTQKNIPERTVPTFGYMYLGDSSNKYDNNSGLNESITDYTVENASTFNKRDKYLYVPSSTPDAFMVSGEGLSGGFRMYNDRIGIFSPNYIKNTTNEKHFGIDIHLGQNIGKGAEVTLGGFHDLEVKSSWDDGEGNTNGYWFVPQNFNDSNKIVSENMFFRFNNDLGGKVEYETSNKPISATISGKQPYLPSSELKILKNRNVPSDSNRRSSRASYVGYHTNREITTFSGGKRPLAYEQREDINIQAGRADTTINKTLRDGIGEVSVINEGGNRYTYGLPVYTAGEKNMRRGLLTTSTNKYLVQSDPSEIKVGEEYESPYASQYLLTQITTPDYLDINGNGPDEQDYGGYTKFSYSRLAGSSNKTAYTSWYKWRSPYNGYMYAPNRLSDNTDDMGSFQSGYKEVYYLDTIQTKTHFAVFITDSRLDGIEANHNDVTAGASSVQGTMTPKKLKEIKLYAKSTVSGSPNKLIKTIHLDYTYSCWPGNINSSSGNGKLTLKKVWFEYNGVVNAKISPYQFEYKYPLTANYPAQYSYIQTEMSGLAESPTYTPYIDCWGNYQYDGNARRQLMKSWVSQAPHPTFDPAAWQLKNVILPSGGQIHIQYEQNSYSYVQDRRSHALVSLLSDDWAVANGNTYSINCAEIGVNTDVEKDSLVALVNRTCKNEKIFFKFFYTLKGNDTEPFGSCNGDYIEGYVNFTNCYKTGTGPSSTVSVVVDGLPKETCEGYVKYQIGGKLLDRSCASPAYPGPLGTGGSASSVIGGLTSLAPMLISKVKTALPGSNICMRAKGNVSYLRIPIPKKLGGGIRVKRLLMFNKGIDVGSPTLYGTEYCYENTTDGTSYGVATNEPFENKGENPLVTFLPKRGEQPLWDRLIAGKDREQFEGPISWNNLPSPSIGYSRVIKKNIYQSNSTGTGYSVIDYNTVKDYPFDGYYGNVGEYGVSHTTAQHVKDKWSIEYKMLSYNVNTGIKSAQGFCFIKNQMHGQIKQISDYRGAFDAVKFNSITLPPVPVSQKSYSYFEPGEKIPMYDFNKWSIYYDNPGKETDITIEKRAVVEHSKGIRMTSDFTIGVIAGVFGGIPYPIALPVNSQSTQEMHTIVVNKTIHYPAIMRQMIVMKDGYYQKSVYSAFDPNTSKPVLTRTYDGFDKLPLAMEGHYLHDGSYTAYNIPASSNYPQMGQKAWNERYYYIDSSGINVTGAGSVYSISGVNIKGAFNIGDQVALHTRISGSTYNIVEMAHVTSLVGNNLRVTPSLKYNSTLTTGTSCFKVEVIHSGHTNQLGSSMDGFTEYGHAGGLAEFLERLNYLINLVKTTSLDETVLDMSSFGFKISALDPVTLIPLCTKAHFIDRFKISKSGGILSVGYQFTGDSYYSSPASFGSFSLLSPVNISHTEIAGVTYLTVNDETSKIGLCSDFKNIIKAQVTRYSDSWVYDDAYGIDTTVLNHYESGMRGKWRPKETYVFRDTIVNGSKPTEGQRNYFAGVAPFSLVKWDTIHKYEPEKWIRSNYIDHYSPNGNATQEFDAENVYSAAKYGYRGILPYIVAQNSMVNGVVFESFENLYTSGGFSYTEDKMSVDGVDITKGAHTGYYSYLRSPSETIILPRVVCQPMKSLSLRYWVKVQGNPTTIFGITSSPSSSTSLTPKFIARSGAWALYESIWTSASSSSASVRLTIKNNASHDILFDDIRVQPTEAKATSYVYDIGTYKLSAVLDDQHFATYYQYNGEGKLVRTMVETEKGIKTVEESQYHVPLISR